MNVSLLLLVLLQGLPALRPISKLTLNSVMEFIFELPLT